MYFLMQKHAVFNVTVFTNHSVLFVTFLVHLGSYPYMSLTVHIRLVKNTARSSLIEAMIVKTAPDFGLFYPLI